MVNLPVGVQAVRARGRVYYYWAPNRNTGFAGKRVPLGRDPTSPEFWSAIDSARGTQPPAEAPGTFAALIRQFKNSEKWRALRRNTRNDYEIYLGRIAAAWGELQVAGLTAIGIYKLRDQYSATPSAANHLIAVLRALLVWGIPRGYHDRNPAADVAPIELDVEGARPWPEDAYRYIVEHAPECVRRAVILGRATGQRRSDVVLFGKKNRRLDGLDIKIGKLHDKKHFVPLRPSEISEIDAWSCSDTGPWIVNQSGRPISGDYIAELLDDYVEATPALKDAGPLKMHGLRAMAVCDRRYDALEHQEIAAALGMSIGMVIRYSRKIDQESLARRGNQRRQDRTSGEQIAKTDSAGLKNTRLSD